MFAIQTYLSPTFSTCCQVVEKGNNLRKALEKEAKSDPALKSKAVSSSSSNTPALRTPSNFKHVKRALDMDLLTPPLSIGIQTVP